MERGSRVDNRACYNISGDFVDRVERTLYSTSTWVIRDLRRERYTGITKRRQMRRTRMSMRCRRRTNAVEKTVFDSSKNTVFKPIDLHDFQIGDYIVIHVSRRDSMFTWCMFEQKKSAGRSESARPFSAHSGISGALAVFH